MTAVIETDGLTKMYGRSRGIEDLSMSVGTGEVFGFLGPNGAGKTTTIRTLLDLLHPTSGSARVFGLDSRRESVAIRARVGNLPGDFAYDDRLSGREVLRLFGDLRGVDPVAGSRRLAERFQADLSRPLRELSRGNRQKIGLIQAFFHDPELVVLDEPTTGLDPLMQEEFLTLIAEYRERGGTAFISSHDLEEIERSCDRVGIIRDGRLVAVEDVEEMRGRAYRSVSVTFARTVAPAELVAVDGVEEVTEREARTLEFRVHGSIDPVVKAIAAHEVVDIEVTRPTLEQLFLTYYGDGESL